MRRKLRHRKMYVFAPRPCIFQILITLSVVGSWLSAPPVSGEEFSDPAMALVALDEQAGVWRDVLQAMFSSGQAILLDRENVEALMREREILLSENRPGDLRDLLEKWVGADVLISLESYAAEGGSSDALRVRVLDGKTGIRLLDRTLRVSANQLRSDLMEVAAWIEGAGVEAWRALWGEETELKAVTVLDVNLTSVPPDQLGHLDLLGFQLEQRLMQDPGVVLLERELLEMLLEEQNLNPALQRKLTGSLCMLRLSFQPDPGGIRYVVRGLSSDGRELFRRERGDILGAGRISPTALVDMALEATHDYFKLPGEVLGADLKAEALRFLEMATYYEAMNRMEKALLYAGTAFLMYPSSREIHLHYQKTLYSQVGRDIRRSGSARRNPDTLDELISDFRRLVEVTAPLPRQLTYLRNLFGDFQRFWGGKLTRQPEMEMKWEGVQREFRRTFEFSERNEKLGLHGHLADQTTAEERNAYFEVKLMTRTPLSGSDFFWLVGKWTHFGDMPFGPLPESLARSLISQVREDPHMPGVEKHKWLSILYFALRDRDPEAEDFFREHLHQLLLQGIQDPNVLGIIPNVKSFDPDYLNYAHAALMEYRDRIESEGWFLPELYRMDNGEGFDRFMLNLRDPSMRLVPRKFDPPFVGDFRDEMLKRMTGWGAGHLWGKLRDGLYETTSESVQFTTLYQGGRPILATGVFGEVLVVRAGGRHGGDQELRFYRQDRSGTVHLDDTLPLPRPVSGERQSASAVRFFRQKVFPGTEHLYVPFHHRLLIIGEDFSVKCKVVLADLGFPGYSVVNLLETEQGLLVGVTHRNYHIRGGTGASRRGASALLLLDDDGKIVRIVSHTDRSPAENALDKVKPHDFIHMIRLPTGDILIQPTWQPAESYRLDSELVRIEKLAKNPSRDEQLAAYLGFPGEAAEKGNLYQRFYEMYDANFELPRVPAAYFTEPQIARIGERLFGVSRRVRPASSKTDKRVYEFPVSGSKEAPRVLEVDVSSETMSLKSWEPFLVLDDPNRIRILDTRNPGIGKREHAFVRRPESEEFEAWRSAYEEAYREVPLQGIDPPEEPAKDSLIEVPGGTYTRFPDEQGASSGTYEIQPFRLGRTEVTLEEWGRVLRWAHHKGYRFINHGRSKAPELPIVGIFGWDAVLYCNARSEMEGLKPAYYMDDARQVVLRDATLIGNTSFAGVKWTPAQIDLESGYRLPTEEEWEFAARGGDPEHRYRYPWGDRISHGLANYRATAFFTFDDSDGGISEAVAQTVFAPLSPVGSFPGHGYKNKFHDLIGNAGEMVMTGFPGESVDPAEGSAEIRIAVKGGSWASNAEECSINVHKKGHSYGRGFRVLLPSTREPSE